MQISLNMIGVLQHTFYQMQKNKTLYTTLMFFMYTKM